MALVGVPGLGQQGSTDHEEEGMSRKTYHVTRKGDHWQGGLAGASRASVKAGTKCVAGAAVAEISPANPPCGFQEGSFTWTIPMQYRKKDDTTDSGTEFDTVCRVFSIEDDGTMTVTKDDATVCTVTRSPSPP